MVKSYLVPMRWSPPGIGGPCGLRLGLPVCNSLLFQILGYLRCSLKQHFASNFLLQLALSSKKRDDFRVGVKVEQSLWYRRTDSTTTQPRL